MAAPNFCPRCGSKLTSKFDGGRDRAACPDESCGFIDYGNFSIGAAGVVVRDGRALLVQRGWNPNRGAWQLPGGYVEHDEEILSAVEREVLEEAGIEAKVRDVVGFRHSVGGSIGGPSTNIYLVFRLEETGFAEPTFDGDEVMGAGFFSQDEMANMERVQSLSTWAIQKALRMHEHGGLHPEIDALPTMRGGWSLFGARHIEDMLR